MQNSARLAFPAFWGTQAVIGAGRWLNPAGMANVNRSLGAIGDWVNQPGVGGRSGRAPAPAPQRGLGNIDPAERGVPERLQRQWESDPSNPYTKGRLSPGPQQTAPGVNEPIVYSGAANRASELNARYQQGGGDPTKNYWEANPEVTKAAAVGGGPRANQVGYSDRADIVAWKNAMLAQGKDGKRMVDKFMADQERRGLIAKPEGSGVTATMDNLRAAANAGLTPDQLAKAEAYTQTAQAMPGGTSLQNEIQDAAWKRDDKAWQQDPDFGTDRGVPDVGLGGSQGLANAPNGPVDLRQAQAQAPWQGENPALNSFQEGVGNFHSSGQIRAMNLSGDQALEDAKVQQLMATRTQLGATAEEPNSLVTDRPEDKLLNQYMQTAFGAYKGYQAQTPFY